MYAQASVIRVPVGGMPNLRRLIEHSYLPGVSARAGFISAALLEQVDDPESALLMVYWDSQGSVEAFHRTGALQATVQALAAEMPGLHVERESYVVTVSVVPRDQPVEARTLR